MNKISMRIGISMLVLVLSIWACGGSDKATDQGGEAVKTEIKVSHDGIKHSANAPRRNP